MSREPNELDSYSDYIDGPEPDSTGLNHERDPDADRENRYPGGLMQDCRAVETITITREQANRLLFHVIKSTTDLVINGRLENRLNLADYYEKEQNELSALLRSFK
jgi:hypothetical protein